MQILQCKTSDKINLTFTFCNLHFAIERSDWNSCYACSSEEPDKLGLREYKMLLEIKDLHVWFKKKSGIIKAVNGVSFSISSNESLGLVGESGSGKSVTALSVLRLVPSPGEIVRGEIKFEGRNLLTLPEQELYHLRGRKIAMIFQDPMTALNPVFTIGEQIEEVFNYHLGYTKKESRSKTIELLKLVGIPGAESRLNAYPHQLSGGMRQRVMIAMALAAQPKLLIADEPTTALDVTVQAQILTLLQRLKKEMEMSILFISHDLTVVAQIAERIAVMYAGSIVETAKTEEIFTKPLHPYTEGLLKAIPNIEHVSIKKDFFKAIPEGKEVFNSEIYCPFIHRCSKKISICLNQRPSLKEISPGHKVACWLYG